ncbi:MAG TPA: flagellar filament capping protein FliD [Candidatus Limnocylindria bacterium]|nr:flagellar filament capping protein FliD [Candidatus Limnocylindria bacterium]
MAISLSGLATGFDWQSVVDQLTEVERTPQTRLRAEQTTVQERNNAYGAIKTQLGVLQNRVKALTDGSLFDSRGVTVSNSSAGSATAGAGTPLGSYTFAISQLATAASLRGTSDIGAKLNATNDVSALALSNAAFRTPVTAGTFTVNGKQITVAATDTLQGVFDKISTATGGMVTAAYDSSTDHIRLTGAGEIILGSATDSSNFLQAAQLTNNGTGAVESSANLGAIRVSQAMSSGNFTTPMSATGEFKVNGVSITFDSANDSLTNVLDRINNSTAGVNASYDALNDRVVLTNRVTGDIGVAIEDVTGNFAAATGLGAGTLEHGKNLLYSVNGGATITAQSNTITDATSGITGLNVTATAETTFSVNVATDSTKIKTAISDLVAEYNKTQALIDTNTASTTDAKGKVTAGTLTGDSDAAAMNSDLRKLMNGEISGLTGSIFRLESLGYTSNGNDDALVAGDAAKLESAIANNLSSLKDFFTNSTVGLGAVFNTYLDKTIGENGSLVNRQTRLTAQSKGIDTQIADMERQVLANKARLTTSFIAMETAQASINQQLQYLQRTFPA